MRLIVLTSERTGLASDCVEALSVAGLEIARVVLTRGLSLDRSKLRSRRVRKVRQIGVLGAANGVRMRAWYDAAPCEDLSVICERHGIPVFETLTTNGLETERLFREADADLGVSIGNSYINERIFGIPRMGMINFHGEILPQYQNAQSVIWPIYNMETATGLTIHQIDKGIDTGAILYQETYPIVFKPTLRETVVATSAVTRARGPAAIARVCHEYPALAKRAVPQNSGTKYTTPSFGQFLRMVHNNRILFYRARSVVK